jgi:hypothetical protein
LLFGRCRFNHGVVYALLNKDLQATLDAAYPRLWTATLA